MTDLLLLVPFGNQCLALTSDQFHEALERGRALVGSTATAPPSNGGEPERLLTTSEISEVTGIPGPWFQVQARLGLIPHVKLGKYVRFRFGEVVEHGAVTPPAEAGGKWTRQKGKRAGVGSP
jgi:hypothetical protein